MTVKETQDLTIPGLVHDLKNVFQTILDAADLLSGDPRWKGLAGAIQRSAEHGRRLSHSVSQASHSTFDFAVIAQIAVQFAQDFLQATHAAEITFHTAVEPGLRLLGNPVAWERVLVNLMLNSAQAMPLGGRVDLHASRKDGVTQITIADNGPGIEPDVMSRIFEPHFSTKSCNTGLGLHIVRSIVESNGGCVNARNRQEGGAEFAITLY